MQRPCDLLDKRNTLFKTAESLIQTAKASGRDLTSDEGLRFSGCVAEMRAIDGPSSLVCADSTGH